MTEDEALDKFSDWYELCVESGLEPEAIIARMGGMVLITDEVLIERLQDEGVIP